MLATVIRRYWLALVRDVIALGYRASDILTTLTWSEMLAIVVGSNPHTSVRFFLDQGWSRESQLLANMAEGQAGLAKLQEPIPRPGIEQRPQGAYGAGKALQADAYTWEEFDELQAKRSQHAGGKSGMRVL